MSEENTATPVEASATPATDEAAEALFNASGDGKTAPPVDTKQTEQQQDKGEAAPDANKATPPVTTKPEAPPLDPVKAAEARATEIEREKQAKVVADEAARIEAERKAAAEKAAQDGKAQSSPGSDLASVQQNVLAGLKDLKIKMVKDGQEVDASLEDFMDDAKGYGEVARGAITAAVAIAAKMVEPLQARIAAYEGEKAREAASAAHQDFISKVADETSHKDVAEVEKSDALWDWLKTQTPQMQALASSNDVRDIDLLLSAFKSATGYKAQASTGKTDRQAIVDKQRADRDRADRIARATTRSRSGGVTGDSEGDIETIEDAEKAFNEAAKKAAK